MDKKFTGLGRCCGRAWLLADMKLLFILKSWINEVISFLFDTIFLLFDTVRVPVFHSSKNRTENRFHIPVSAVNRVPVHKTNYQWLHRKINFKSTFQKHKLFLKNKGLKVKQFKKQQGKNQILATVHYPAFTSQFAYMNFVNVSTTEKLSKIPRPDIRAQHGSNIPI